MFRKCLLVYYAKKRFQSQNLTSSFSEAGLEIRYTRSSRMSTYYLDFSLGSWWCQGKMILAEYGELDPQRQLIQNGKTVSLQNFAISVIGTTLLCRSLWRVSKRKLSQA